MPVKTRTGYANRLFVSTNSSMEEVIGYSRAVRDGKWIFVSNTSGFDYDAGVIADSVIDQTTQMLINIEEALTAAGGAIEDIIRVNLFVSKPDYLAEIRPVIAQMIKRANPSLTAICVPLARENLKVEMEVTACVNSDRNA